MTDASPEEFRELLFADVALMQGHAQARQVAAALLKYWDRRERVETTLAEELATIANIPKDVLGEIEAEVERLVNASHGDPRLAVTRRGGLTHELHAAVSRKDGEVSRQLTELGAGIRVALRTLPKDRYLDFMPVGQGGMGIVYWAMDTELGRQVAFKVVRPPEERPGVGVTPPAPVRMRAPDMGTEFGDAFEELKARFLQEAWVTGGMEHPGIVPVYELGTTEGGVPYYTMRFVRGRRTLQTAIEELSERPFDERVTLLEPFLKVCDAMSYAHSRGVVHRDIKPANVALGEYGEAVVLDWGLAKLKGHPDVHASRWQARVHEFRDRTDMETMDSALGTPGYMAPEAAAGEVEKVDQLADVYSLGAILFEIVAGKPHVEFRTFKDYAAAVLTSEPTDPAGIDPAVPAALSALCMSALARERNLRPQGVADLAKAIRNWQKQSATEREMEVLLTEAEKSLIQTPDMTVVSMRRQAERATTACQRVLEHRPGDVRANDLLKRARALREAGVRVEGEEARRALLRRVAVIGLVIIAAVGAVVAYVLEQRRQEAETAREIARKERDNAALQRSYAEQAMGFITEDLRKTLEPEGRLDVLVKIGEQARDHYAKISVENETPAEFGRRIRALRQLGDAYLNQGQLPKARDVFTSVAARAREYGAQFPESAVAGFAEARAMGDIARVDYAQGYPSRGRDRAEAALEHLSGDAPADISEREWLEARVDALAALGGANFGIPDWPGAREAFTKAHGIATRLRGMEGAEERHRRLAVRTGLNLAVCYRVTGELGRAVTASTKALSDARMHADDPRSGVFGEYVLAAAESVRAGMYRAKGDSQTAGQMLDGAIKRVRALVARDKANFTWRSGLMRMLLTRGDTASDPMHKYTQGEIWFNEAFAMAKELHAKDPSNANWINNLVTLCDRQAVIASTGRGDKIAHRDYRRQAAEYAKLLSVLETDNARWRLIIAYTMVTYGELEPDPAKGLVVFQAARDHAAYAATLMPHASDAFPILADSARNVESRSKGSPTSGRTMADTFDAVARIAAEHPDELEATRGLVTVFQRSHYARSSDPDNPFWDTETARQRDATKAWLAKQEARGDALPALLRDGLPGVRKELEKIIAVYETKTGKKDD